MIHVRGGHDGHDDLGDRDDLGDLGDHDDHDDHDDIHLFPDDHDEIDRHDDDDDHDRDGIPALVPFHAYHARRVDPSVLSLFACHVIASRQN